MSARIALVHALAESVAPIHAAFGREWSDAELFDVVDTSLSRDLAVTGVLDSDMVERFLLLGRFAAATSSRRGPTRGVLFTCSAFGPALDAVKAELNIPVLKPNEAAFDVAISRGGRIGLLVTFEPSLKTLKAELETVARTRGVIIDVVARHVPDALPALAAGDADTHDQLIAEAAASMTNVGTLVLGQFSAARAAASIDAVAGRQVLTTPACAVTRLRELVEGAPSP